MKPIPKALLIHNAELKKVSAEDKWGNEDLHETEILQKVRLEPSSKIIRGTNSSEVQLSATLIFDCRNSKPQNIKFELDDIIIFNGEKHRVQLIEPFYDAKKLHHYEIGLVKKI